MSLIQLSLTLLLPFLCFTSAKRPAPHGSGAGRERSTRGDEEKAGDAGTKSVKKKAKTEGAVREEKIDPEVLPLLVEPADAAQAKYRESRRKRNRKQGRDSDDDEEESSASHLPSAPLRSESADELQVRLLVGRDVYNSDTAHLHYQRRLQRAKAATGGAVSGVSAAKASSASSGTSYVDRQQPSEAAIDRLVEDEKEAARASATFSRRRRFNPGEDVSYINDNNRTFNHKLSRAYDQFTLDIAQNIERGTAL